MDEHLTEDAGVSLAAVVVESALRQVDEAGVERLQFRRHLLQVAFGGHLAANLQEPGNELLEPGRRQEMFRLQLGHRCPFVHGGDEQGLIVVGDGFVGKLHGRLSVVRSP